MGLTAGVYRRERKGSEEAQGRAMILGITGASDFGENFCLRL